MAFHAHMILFEFEDESNWFETTPAAFHGYINDSLQPYIAHFTGYNRTPYPSAQQNKNRITAI